MAQGVEGAACIVPFINQPYQDSENWYALHVCY
jgi:hypothetical protein